MSHEAQGWVLAFLILFLAVSPRNSQARLTKENGVTTSIFLSPKFMLQPGSVVDKYFYDIDFPRGHIALKSFNAEVVDETGIPVPLQETYLHHWVIVRYYQREGVDTSKLHGHFGSNQSDYTTVRNSGVCDNGLLHYFGLGSETRQTSTHVPDPYGIEIGNTAEVPAGYQERWLLNVHAIDTRGAEDRLGCTECRCDLYNVTEDENGQPFPPDYVGGLRCCYDETRCKLKEGFQSARRGLYMRYTVKWVDWDNSIVPVKIYILDVTDTWKMSNESTGVTSSRHNCLVEYDIQSCPTGVANDGCTDTSRVSLSLPTGGDVIYGVAHQHTGGIGSALYGEDGRVICSSIPTYGRGKEAGNEAGYIVGMSTCHPRPGSVKISKGETLVLESNYSSAKSHTGVMGLFYLLIADPSLKVNSLSQVQTRIKVPTLVWGEVLVGVAVAIMVFVAYRRRKQRKGGYESVVM